MSDTWISENSNYTQVIDVFTAEMQTKVIFLYLVILADSVCISH